MVRGDVDAAISNSEVSIEVVYETPIEHHHPMEPHATIAVWEGEQLTLYNGSQIVNGAQNSAAATLNMSPENVRIITPYIGGGFGSKGGQWANLVLAATIGLRPDSVEEARRDSFGLLARRVREHDGELVAAEAADDVGGTQVAPHDRCQ